MSSAKPASLAPTLLFAKGRARPVAYDPDYGKMSRPGTADPALALGRHAGTRRGSNPPGEVKLSFHVDSERHRRLKLAMAHLRRTGQEFVIAAIDHYLAHVVPSMLSESCACLETGKRAGGCLSSGIGPNGSEADSCLCTVGSTSGRSGAP